MTVEEYDAFCSGLTATTHVVQWGGSQVWKVGGKVFAIAGSGSSRTSVDNAAITFKTSDVAFAMLADQPGLRPAPYLASRGLKWIQHYGEPGLTDDELRAYLLQSYRMVAGGLTAKKRRELGLA